MSNLRIIDSSLSDSATLADGNSNIAASMPVTNLQNSLSQYFTRTTNTSDLIINVDFAADQVISAVHLGRTNFTSAATWRIQCYDAASQTGTVVYDSTAIEFIVPLTFGELDWGVDAFGASAMEDWSQRFATHWFSPVAVRSMRITISDSANGDGYLQAGRLFIGRYFSPSVNCDWGASLRWVDTSEQYRTAGGSLRTENKYTYREIDVQLSWLDDGEATKLLDMQKGNGKRSDYFFSLFPSGSGQRKLHHEFIAKMQDTGPMGLRFVNYSTNSIRFVES